MKLIFFSTLAMSVCGQIAAACPKAADLAGGIIATEDDGITHLFRHSGPGVVSVDSDFGDGSIGRNQLAQGVYVLRLAVEDGGVLDLSSVFQTAYALPLTDLPLPKPGLKQKFRTTVTTMDETYKEAQDQVWGPAQTTTLGDCTFNSIAGTIVYTNDLEKIVETVLYLPDLGIGLLTSYAYNEEPAENYVFTAIAAAK